MNKQKRFLGIILAAALLAGLVIVGSGCEKKLTTQELITKSIDNLNAAKSIESSIDMIMDMELMGMRVQMTTKGSVVNYTSPMRAKIDMDMSALGQNIDMEMYMEQIDEKFIIYTGMNGEWTYQELSDDDFAKAMSQYDSQSTFKLYANSAKNFESLGEETINDVKVEKIEGFIAKEELSKVLMESGALNQLTEQSAGVFDESMISSMFEGIGDLPMTMWISREKLLPVRMDMDLSDVVGKMFSGIMGSMDLDVGEITIHEYRITTDYLKFDEADEFVIPEAALAAK